MKSVSGLIWRLLLMLVLLLWIPSALLYGISLAELPEGATEELCTIRGHSFSPEDWRASEEAAPWWRFTSVCNSDVSLVPDWWILAVLLPAFLFVHLGASVLRGGAPSPLARALRNRLRAAQGSGAVAP